MFKEVLDISFIGPSLHLKLTSVIGCASTIVITGFLLVAIIVPGYSDN